jgi:branched-chain amino acid aminotransferase
MQANGITGDGYIRLVVTRGIGSLGLSISHTANPSVIVIADKIALYPPEVYERGLHCVISSLARNHPNTTSPRVKSLNYLNNIMAKAEAKEAGADEAIMLTTDGFVSECTGDNIFVIREGAVFTPPTCMGILEGITRNLAMDLARKRGIPVHERVLIRHDLHVADECFATGTAAEIIPITEIDGRPVADGKPGPITKQLITDFVDYRNKG